MDEFLNILHVDPSQLTEIEKNALDFFLVPLEELEEPCSYMNHVKIDHFITTLALIMELKVHSRCTYGEDVAIQIRTMGWCNEFAEDLISTFVEDVHGCSGWGHRLVSDWAKGWLSGFYNEHLYKFTEKYEQMYSEDGTPVF
jgi:hypothetical protein